MVKENDYFTLLGLTKESTPADLNKLYKRKALLTHPDKSEPIAKQEEENLTFKIFLTPLSKKDIREVKSGKLIAFENKNGSWFIHAFQKPTTRSLKLITYFEKQIIDPGNLLFLQQTTRLLKKDGETHIVVEKGESRETLDKISIANGRTEFKEAYAEQFKQLSAINEILSNPAVFCFFQSIESECDQQGALLATQVKRLILGMANSDFVNALKGLCDDNRGQLNPQSYTFIKASVKFLFRFSGYLISSAKVKNNQHDSYVFQLNFLNQTFKLLHQTYSEHLKEQDCSHNFPSGSSLFTLLVNAMTDNAVYLVDFIHASLESNQFSDTRKLREFQIQKVQTVASTNNMLFGNNPMLLGIALLDINLLKKVIFSLEPVFIGRYPPEIYNLIFLLLNDSIDQTSESSQQQRSVREQQQEYLKIIRPLIKARRQSFSEEEKSQLFNDQIFFMNHLNEVHTKLFPKLTLEKRSTAFIKTLIIDYLFHEVANLLLIRQAYYSHIAESPNKINRFNVERIKENLLTLENRLTLLSNVLAFILANFTMQSLKQHERQLEQTAKCFLTSVVENQVAASANYLKSLELLYADDIAKFSDRGLQNQLFSSLAQYLSETVNYIFEHPNDALTLHRKDGSPIHSPPLTYLERRTINQLGCLTRITALGLMAYHPSNASQTLRSDGLSISDMLHDYLNELASQNIPAHGSIKILQRRYLTLTDQEKYFHQKLDEMNKIARDYNSLKKAIDRFIHSLNSGQSLPKKNGQLFSTWLKNEDQLSKELDRVSSMLYQSEYSKLLFIICHFDKINVDNFIKLCKKYLKSERLGPGSLSDPIVYLLGFLESNAYQQDINNLLPKYLWSNPDNETFDYSHFSAEQARSLGAYIFTLSQLSRIHNGLQQDSLRKRIDDTQKDFHERNYKTFLNSYKEWLNYTSNNYQNLNSSIRTIERNISLLTREISQLEQQWQKNIMWLSGLDKSIPSSQELTSAISFIERLKARIEDINNQIEKLTKEWQTLAVEINSFYLNVQTSARKLTGYTGKQLNWDESLELMENKRLQLGEQVESRDSIDNQRIITDNFPSLEQVSKLRASLSAGNNPIMQFGISVDRMKRETTFKLNSIMLVKQLVDHQTSEYHATKSQLTQYWDSLTRYQSSCKDLFDIDLFTKLSSSRNAVGTLLKKAREISKLIVSGEYDNCLMQLRAKVNNINLLQSRLQQTPSFLTIEKQGHEELLKPHEAQIYEQHLLQWPNAVEPYLNAYLKTSLSQAHAILHQLITFDSENRFNTAEGASGYLELKTNHANLLQSFYELLEIIELYHRTGISLLYSKQELEHLNQTLHLTRDAIESIDRTFNKQEKPTERVVIRGDRKKPASQRKKTKKKAVINHASSSSLKATTSLQNQKAHYETSLSEFNELSHHVLSLELQLAKTKNTRETILEKVYLPQDRERLSVLLEESMQTKMKKLEQSKQEVHALREKSLTYIDEILTPILDEWVQDISSQSGIIDEIKRCLSSRNYCDLLLIEVDDDEQLTLQLETNDGEKLSVTMPKTDQLIKNQTKERLLLALRAFNNLNDKSWHFYQAEFLLKKMDSFLEQINPSQHINKELKIAYQKQLGNLLRCSLEIKEKINLFLQYKQSNHSDSYRDEINEKYNQLCLDLFNLQTQIQYLEQYSVSEPLLNVHLERLRIFEVNTMLTQIITEHMSSPITIPCLPQMHGAVELAPVPTTPINVAPFTFFHYPAQGQQLAIMPAEMMPTNNCPNIIVRPP